MESKPTYQELEFQIAELKKQNNHLLELSTKLEESERKLKASLDSMADAEGHITGSVVTARDITEIKKIEADLVENQKRHEKYQELGHVGNWEYNIKSGKLWISNEAKRLLGFDLSSNNFGIEQVKKITP